MRSLNRILRCVSGATLPVAVSEVPRREESGEFVRSALAAAVPRWGKGVTRLPLDGTYYLTTEAAIRDVVAADLTDWLQYTEGAYDCENYALALAGKFQEAYGVNGVGVVVDWSANPAHAYNVVVAADGTVRFVEPQSDTWYTPGEFPVDDTHRLESARLII